MYRMVIERREKKQASEKMERRYRGHGRKDMDENDGKKERSGDAYRRAMFCSGLTTPTSKVK